MPLLPSRTGSLGFRGREFERAAKVVTFCNTPESIIREQRCIGVFDRFG